MEANTNASNSAVLASPSMPQFFAKALQPLLDSPVEMPFLATPPLGIRQLIEMNTYTFQSGLDWMVKKEWNNKHKVRGDRNLRKSTEPLGNFLSQVLRLCERCHTSQHFAGVDIPYSSPSEWFQRIVLEFYVAGFQQIMYQLYPSELFLKPNEGGAKKQAVRQIHAICSLANNMERPCLASNLAFPLLLDRAIGVAEQSSNFKNQFYEPFTKSWRKSIDVVEKHWVTGFLTNDGEELHCRIGSGKNVRNLTKKYEVSLREYETYLLLKTE